MQLRKYRWSRAYESAEEELTQVLAAKNITAQRFAAEEAEAFPARTHDAATQLWCAEGMFTVQAGAQTFSMQPGDVLDIPAAMVYDLTSRFGGCVWYESTYTTNQD